MKGEYAAHRRELELDFERSLLAPDQIRLDQRRPYEEARRRYLEARHAMLLAQRELDRAQTAPVAFVKHCAVAGCEGYLSTAWKCGACGAHTCNLCHAPKQEGGGHACSPEALASVRMLATASKPCPGCRATIVKSEGCDQMWCPKCKKAFSWRTGQLVGAGTYIHNPEFLRYLRENNLPIARAPGDAPGCPRSDLAESSLRLERAFRGLARDQTLSKVSRTLRMGIHYEGTVHHHLAQPLDRSQTNAALRIKLLRKDVTQEQFDKAVQKRAKQRAVSAAIVEVQGMVVAVLATLARQLATRISSPTFPQDATAFLADAERLRERANELLREVALRYTVEARIFTSNWGFMTAALERRNAQIAANLAAQHAARVAPQRPAAVDELHQGIIAQLNQVHF